MLAVMSRQLGARASELLRVEDDIAAWCLDEAVFDILLRLSAKEKLRPKMRPKNNAAVIAMLKGGGKRGA